MQVIYRQQPKVSGPNHFGSRLVFARDGSLFVTQGDRLAYREQAQDLSSGIGKIVRINPDGSVPKDNPFANGKGIRPEIWSYGHEISKAPRWIRRRVNFGPSSTALAAGTS
jgi:aldose sugar dehydrogenase